LISKGEQYKLVSMISERSGSVIVTSVLGGIVCLIGCSKSPQVVTSDTKLIPLRATVQLPVAKSVPVVAVELGKSSEPRGRLPLLGVSTSSSKSDRYGWFVNCWGNSWVRSEVDPALLERCNVEAIIRLENQKPILQAASGTNISKELQSIFDSKIASMSFAGDGHKPGESTRVIVLRTPAFPGRLVSFNFVDATDDYEKFPGVFEESQGNWSWRFISVSVPAGHRYADVDLGVDFRDVSEPFDPRRSAELTLAGHSIKFLGMGPTKPDKPESEDFYYADHNWHSVLKFSSKVDLISMMIQPGTPRPVVGNKIGIVNAFGEFEMEDKHTQLMDAAKSERPGALYRQELDNALPNATQFKTNLAQDQQKSVVVTMFASATATLRGVDLDPQLQ